MKKQIITIAMGSLLVFGCQKNQLPTVTQAPTLLEPDTADLTLPAASVYPVTYEARDKAGTIYQQSVSKVPERVITGTPSATELLFELGLGHLIIGTVALDNDPPLKWQQEYQQLNVLGDKKTVSREILVGIQPDLIIGRSFTFAEDSFGTIGDLNDVGIAVYTQVASYLDTTQSLEQIIVDVRNIGKIFQEQETAKQYAAELEKRLSDVQEQIKAYELSEPQRVLVMTGFTEQTFGVFGANAALQSNLLATVGAVNVMETGSSGLSLEHLIAVNPDAIIYITAKRNETMDQTAIAELYDSAMLQQVPAITNKKIIAIPYDDFMDYGVRNFDTLEQLMEFLYAE